MVCANIPTLELDNVKLLGYARDFQFFGGDIAFKRTVSVSVVGVGVSHPDFIHQSPDYAKLILNGKEYPEVKLTSLSSRNIDPHIIEYNVGFEFYEQADSLEDLKGAKYYADFGNATLDSYGPLIDEITENTQVSVGENSISYKKNISLKFNDSVHLTYSDNEELVRLAQETAKSIFDWDASSSYEHVPTFDSDDSITGLLNGEYRRIRTETIDLINNNCSFTESTDAENVKTDDDGDYSASSNQNFTFDESGIVTASESGRIQGLTDTNTVSRSQAAENGYQIELDAAKTRLSNLVSAHNCPLGDSLYINNGEVVFLTTRKTVFEREGVIEYEVSVTNDPKYKDGNPVIHEFQQTVSTTEVGYQIASERGIITGLSNVQIDPSKPVSNLTERYPKHAEAMSYFTNISEVSGIIDGRLESLINNPSPYSISRNETHSLFQGRVEYTREFSNEPVYSDNGNYKYKESFSNESIVTEKKVDYPVLNHRYIIQRRSKGGTTQGIKNITAEILDYRIQPNHTNGKNNADSMLSECISIMDTDDVDTCGSEKLLRSASYNYEYLNDVKMNLSTAFYKGLRAP